MTNATIGLKISPKLQILIEQELKILIQKYPDLQLKILNNTNRNITATIGDEEAQQDEKEARQICQQHNLFSTITTSAVHGFQQNKIMLLIDFSSFIENAGLCFTTAEIQLPGCLKPSSSYQQEINQSVRYSRILSQQKHKHCLKNP